MDTSKHQTPTQACGCLSGYLYKVFFILVFTSVLSSCAFGQADIIGEVEIDQLIVQLSDAKFERREIAKQKLLRIGASALPKLKQLRKLSSDSDFHSMLEAQSIISKIESGLSKLKAESFLNQKRNLPGWSEFSQKYGDSELSREPLCLDLPTVSRRIGSIRTGKSEADKRHA